MKKLALMILMTLSISSAFAMDTVSSVDQLPANAVIEPLITTTSFERPQCPRGYVVAKKYCWSKEDFCFHHCGYICSKIPPSNDRDSRH
ncbi:hypothetical protein [Bdellovibrio sp. BCCA]|uniref:hypothetical protein n=1 Tax=Bdellovibrio sp. BCCA TaxID=3136281 RepID=UPI0030F18BD5